METKCKNIRKNLKEAIHQYQISRDLIDRLLSLRGMILRLAKTKLQAIWLEKLLQKIESFIREMRTDPINAIESKLKEVEEDTLSHLVADLNIPAPQFTRMFNDLKNQNRANLKLCEILPKFLKIYFKLNIPSNSLAVSDFKHNAAILFRLFQIPYNFYVEAVANKYFGDDYTYDLSKLEGFLSLFFGPIENYKFYVRIAEAVDEFQSNLEGSFLPFNYKITLTAINKQYTGNLNTLSQDQMFEITPIGINNHKLRKDRLVIFGRHPDSDIVFPPDEKMIDYVCLILLNCSDNIYAIDVSKKTNVAFKFHNGENHILTRGMLINIAKTQTFHIEEILNQSQDVVADDNAVTYFEDDNEAILDSFISLECIEGIYIGNKFTLSTKTKNPNLQKLVHMFGCGGSGDAPDFFIPRESGISRKHVEFRFDIDNKRWVLFDEKSVNGTFILLKNIQQYKYKRISNLHRVFDQVTSSFAYKTILVGRYVFYVMAGDT